SFMPYFFGIYLLQGSFLLLLIADKLQGEASEAVITACETIVRAHEVCVVTLNTEYQVRFSIIIPILLVESILTQITAQLQKSYAFGSQPGARPRHAGGHGGAEAAAARGARAVPVVWGWNWAGSVGDTITSSPFFVFCFAHAHA